MLLAAAAFAYSLGAHFQYWGPNVTQKGVSVGTPGVDERLILFMPQGDCRQMRVFSGQYGDIDNARRLLWRSKLCAGVNN